MSEKIIYSSHAIDPLDIEKDDFPFYMGPLVPDYVSALVQKVYLASIVRMQKSLTEKMVESLNCYTRSGEFYFDELEAMDFEKEIERCRIVMKNTLPPEDFALIEPDSIRVVMEDLLVMVRRHVMDCFAGTFNSLTEDIAAGMRDTAIITSQCILTFANKLTKEQKEIN